MMTKEKREQVEYIESFSKLYSVTKDEWETDEDGDVVDVTEVDVEINRNCLVPATYYNEFNSRAYVHFSAVGNKLIAFQEEVALKILGNIYDGKRVVGYTECDEYNSDRDSYSNRDVEEGTINYVEFTRASTADCEENKLWQKYEKKYDEYQACFEKYESIYDELEEGGFDGSLRDLNEEYETILDNYESELNSILREMAFDYELGE